jgi:catechol 2,3-dioxygenase-like lactoylglutathione lyase family enzyme
MIKGWFHANLVVSNLDRSIRFYEDLGFRTVREREVTNPQVWAKLGLKPGRMRYAIMQLAVDQMFKMPETSGGFSSMVLDICEPIDPAPIGKPYDSLNHIGIGRLSFEVEDIDKTYEMLAAKGVEFLGPTATMPMEWGTMRMFCFRDPDGIVIELGGRSNKPEVNLSAGT